MLHPEPAPLSTVATLIVCALLAAGCAKNGDDAKVGSPASSTTTTAGSSAPLAVCNSARNDECTELFSFGPLGADAEKRSCEARNGEYAAGGSCATHRSLVGVCAHPRLPIGPADKGGLHKKVYSYEVAFDRGTNRVQARAFAKSACDGLSGSWTDAPSTAGRATVNQVLPLAAMSAESRD